MQGYGTKFQVVSKANCVGNIVQNNVFLNPNYYISDVCSFVLFQLHHFLSLSHYAAFITD